MNGPSITESALDEPGVPQLIEAHLALMRAASPPGFVCALDPPGLFTKALASVGVSR